MNAFQMSQPGAVQAGREPGPSAPGPARRLHIRLKPEAANVAQPRLRAGLKRKVDAEVWLFTDELTCPANIMNGS